jgi:hypothetical protein
MRRTWGVALLVLAVAVAGCSDAGDDDDSGFDTAAVGDEATETTMAEAGEAFDGDDSSGAGGGGSTGGVFTSAQEALPDIGARVVRTADLRIEVEKGTFGQQLRAASVLARSLGGFVESSSTSSYEEGEASGEISIRVPVDRYDSAMEQLTELGTVERSSENGEDVTDQLVDLDARLRSLRAEEDALNALMAEAANVNEVLSIRSTAVGIRQQIEQLAAQQASLEDRSSFSTIHVLLHEATADLAMASPGEDDWTIADAFETGVDAARTIVGSVIVVTAVAVPLLPFAAIALVLARRRRVATEG